MQRLEVAIGGSQRGALSKAKQWGDRLMRTTRRHSQLANSSGKGRPGAAPPPVNVLALLCLPEGPSYGKELGGSFTSPACCESPACSPAVQTQLNAWGWRDVVLSGLA